MRVDLEAVDKTKKQATFSNFKVGDEAAQYLLTVTGYSGNAGNIKINISL